MDAEFDSPPDIASATTVLDIEFHPSQDFICLGSLGGCIELWKYADDGNQKLAQTNLTSDVDSLPSARLVRFHPSGTAVICGSGDRSISSFSLENGLAMGWKIPNAHNSPVSVLDFLDDHRMVSGDDDGTLLLWDSRQGNAPVGTFKEHSDFISDVACDVDQNILFTTGGDGCLVTYDIRKTGKVILASDSLDDELLSCCIMKNGQRLLCGSQDGSIHLFKWGEWDFPVDRFPGHPESVETLVPINEDIALSGSSDGIIRILQIMPNKLLGVVGEHEDYPIEKLSLEFPTAAHENPRYVASISHDDCVKFWNVSYLYEEDEENEGEENEDDGGSDGDSEMMDESEDEMPGARIPQKEVRTGAKKGFRDTGDFFSGL